MAHIIMAHNETDEFLRTLALGCFGSATVACCVAAGPFSLAKLEKEDSVDGWLIKGSKEDPKKVDELFDTMDADHNAKISRGEFMVRRMSRER